MGMGDIHGAERAVDDANDTVPRSEVLPHSCSRKDGTTLASASPGTCTSPGTCVQCPVPTLCRHGYATLQCPGLSRGRRRPNSRGRWQRQPPRHSPVWVRCIRMGGLSILERAARSAAVGTTDKVYSLFRSLLAMKGDGHAGPELNLRCCASPAHRAHAPHEHGHRSSVVCISVHGLLLLSPVAVSQWVK